MADQENKDNEDLDNIEPMLDEDSFSLDLDDFDLGDDEIDASPGMEPPLLDEIDSFDEDDEISSMVASSDDDDDFLDIDLDSDLNLLGEDDPVLHDDDIAADFGDIGELDPEGQPEPVATSAKTELNKPVSNIKQNVNNELTDDLELEFDDDIIDLDKEIEAILNGEDGILTSRKANSEFSPNEDEEGPIALSMDELANITGEIETTEESDGLTNETQDEDDFELTVDLGFDEPETTESSFDSPFTSEKDTEADTEEEEVLLPDDVELESELGDITFESESQPSSNSENLISEDSDLDLDLDESEIETHLNFDENGKPELDLSDIGNETETDPEESSFTPLRDAEEEELFGNVKEDENLTLSDDELGNILGASGELSLEETLGSEDDFLASETPAEFETEEPESSFDLLGDDTPIEEPSIDDELSFDDFELSDSDEEPKASTDELEHSFPETDTSVEEEDDGPITLSLDELENISADLEEEDSSSPNILDGEVEDESITLSPDELGNIIAGDPLEEEASIEESTGLEGGLEEFESEDDDGPIALSMDELEAIASDAEEMPEEELVDSLDRAPLPYEENLTPADDLLTENEEDESIALSMEELENITGIEEDALAGSGAVETVTSENLDEILGDEIPGDELEDISDLPFEEPETNSEVEVLDEIGTLGDSADLVDHEDDSSFEVSDIPELSLNDSQPPRIPTLQKDESNTVEIELDEYAFDGKLSPLEELRNSDIKAPELQSEAQDELKNASGETLSPEDKKKVLGYLDNLLGNLPDDMIKEFSKSQYFELYKKMMKELGV